MKINITISLDEDLIYKLKLESNYSNVVNECVRSFYDDKSTENLQILSKKLAEIEQKARVIKRSKIEINKKIKKVKEKESRILNLVKGINKKALDLLIECRSVAVLKAHYNANRPSDPRAYDLQRHRWIDLKKAYEELKGGNKI